MHMKQGNQTTWQHDVNLGTFPTLTGAIEADVAVVGGGITGMTTAYMLSKAGYSVVVLEQESLANGATGMTTAFLTQYLDTDLIELIRIVGKERAKAMLDSHQGAISILEDIVRQEEIDCEFTRCTNYICATHERSASSLEDEAGKGRELGLSMKYVDESNLSFTRLPYIEHADQGKFHPLKYLLGLIPVLSMRGVRMFEHSEAEDIQKQDDHYVVTTPQGNIRARHVVMGTYAPFNKELYFKKAFYTSYVLELHTKSGVLPEAIYQDDENPYHYFRVDPMGEYDRIVLGGEDHRSDIPVDADKNYQSLREYAEELLEGNAYTTVRQWSGPIVEPVDGLAFIGPHEDPNIYYATGFSGNGMTYSVIAADIITSLIQDEGHPWAELYWADRKPSMTSLAVKGKDYSQELIGGAVKNTFKHRKK